MTNNLRLTLKLFESEIEKHCAAIRELQQERCRLIIEAAQAQDEWQDE